jgi:hypothetical protein
LNGESVARRQTRRNSKFSEEQIITILAEQELGMTKIYGGSLQLSTLSKSMRLVKYEDVIFDSLL